MCAYSLFVSKERKTERMALLCSFWDLAVIVASCKGTQYLDALITPATLDLPHPYLYTAASIALWSLYGFWAGLFGTGIWVIGHECGHQAFSESKAVNNTVGWFLHSACVFLLCSLDEEKLTFFQCRCAVPLVARHPCKAPRLDGTHDAGPGLRPQDTFASWPA